MRTNSRYLTSLIAVFLFGLAPGAFTQIQIMPLGNSITRGVDGPSTDDAGFRNDLHDLLTAEGVNFDFVGSKQDGAGFDADHEGHDGFRADEILGSLGTYLGDQPDVDVIILHIGTNDVSSEQTPESTRDEIEDILDAINSFNPDIKIILSSLVPRTDDKDDATTALNKLLEDLFYKKRDDQGRNIFYAGVNELFKHNANWATAYFVDGDDVHPNDAGFAVMGEAYFNAVMVAINATTTLVTDNFERSTLGTTWSADPEFEIQDGELVNTAATGASRWEYLATYRGVRDPNSAAVTWAEDADVDGLDNSGIAILLDAPTNTANGYLGWISPSDNELHLWTVTNGSVDEDLLDVNPTSLTDPPAPGKTTRIDVTVDPAEIKFDYLVDDVFAGSISIDNPGSNGDTYAGIIMRHDRNNDVEAFSLLKATDTIPPDAVDDLTAGAPQATSIRLTWTATGDDDSVGVANRYDLRYATQAITEDNFDAAQQVLSVPAPSVAGTLESANVTGLQPGVQYFFALKVIDEAGNASPISNPASATTVAGNLFADNFNRTDLGANWMADPAYEIIDNRLSNTATDGLWDDIAVLTARKNPIEVTFKFGDNSDADGIDQAGFVIVFSPSATADGYAVTRRTADNTLRLWRLQGGEIIEVIDRLDDPLQEAPKPNDVVKIQITSDGTSNKFDYFINGEFDGRVEDTAFEHDLAQDNWAGVTLRSDLNNDIDDFTVLLEVGAPDRLIAFSGDAQVDTAGQVLPDPLCVQVVDENDSPIQGINVEFEVVAGGGTVDVTLPSDDIVLEAESGSVHSPMDVFEDEDASNGQYIEVPNGAGGGGNLGFAEYLINIEETGDYTLWGRGIFPDAENDAFRVKINGETYQWDLGQRDHQSDWHWDQMSDRGNGSAKDPQFNPVVMSLPAGLYSLVIEEAKDGTKLDQFVITPVGSDFEPPEDQAPVEPGGVFTDAEGLACANLTLGPAPGINTVQASVTGVAPITFSATGLPGAIAVIEKVSGDLQSGQQGEPLPEPFVVELRDTNGNAAVGAEVSFAVLAPGDGTLSTINPVIADGSGRASTTLTMATNVGVNQVQVTAPGYTGEDVIFTAFVPSGEAQQVVMVAGDNQTGTADQPLPNLLQVKVTDNDDIPVSDFPVDFRVLDGGGSLDGEPTRQVATNLLGIAEVALRLGPQGGMLNRVEATAEGLAGSPIIFSANSAAPQTLAAVSEASQNGEANLPLADSIEVRVLDAIGGNLPNHDVIFTITAGDGLVNGSPQAVVKTNSDGMAKVAWRLGSEVGADANGLRAEASYLGAALEGSPVTFSADAVAGPAENLNIVSGDGQTGVVSTRLREPFVIEISDQGGDPVANWPVTFRVTAGDGNLDGSDSTTVFTDGDGRAQATLTLGPNPGSDNNIVGVASPQTSSETFTASAAVTAATTIELVDGDGQTGPAGLPLNKKIQVRVTDEDNENVAGHIVSFRIEGGDGTLNGTAPGDTLKHITSNEDGIARVTWFMGGELGENGQAVEVTSDNGLQELAGSPILVQATATTGPVDPNESFVQADKSAAQANGQDEITVTVTATDRFGNPVAGANVTLSSSNDDDDIVQPQDPTDADGQTNGAITSTIPGERSITARVNDFVLNDVIQIVFLATAPQQVAMNSGNNQSANVNTVAPEQISVLVTDEFDNPVQGITVAFEVTQGGGFILPNSSTTQAAAEAGSANVVNKVTDRDGIASADWVLGPDAGTNLAEARALFNGTELDGSPVEFAATGQVSSPSSLAKHAGDNQTSGAGSALPEPLEVRVTDSQGRPVAEVAVAFDIIEGNGALSNQTTQTDYAGIAGSVLTLGPEIGANRVRARAPDMTGQPSVVFTAEALGGTPSRMTRVAGHNVEVEVNATQEVALLITDLHDNPIAGVDVIFEVTRGGAFIQQPQVLTNDNGVAGTDVQMPTTAGEVVVRATSSLLPDFFVDFNLQAIAGPAATIALFDGDNQEGTVGRTLVLPLQVKVTDAFDNPVAGFTVAWQTDSGNSVAPANSLTDADGIAGANFTIVNLGANTAQAQASGLTGSPVTFTANGVDNNFPEFVGLIDRQVSEGNLLHFEVSAFDEDSDPITYEAEDVPEGAAFNSGNASFTWIPATGQRGEHHVTFIARDNRGGFDRQTITITVSGANNVPVISQATPEESELRFILSQVIVFSVVATDADNDELNYTWLLFKGQDTDGEQVSTSSTFVLDTGERDPASYIVRVRVSDGKDEVFREWKLDVVTSVELSTFMAQFGGFDGVRVSWTTSKELNNTGFHVLRSPKEDGEFTQVNQKLIPSNERGQYEFVDANVEVGRRYYYMLEDVDINGVRTQHGPIEIDVAAPASFELSQNYPNPFNPETKIRFQLPQAGAVEITVFDVLGRKVITLIDERKDAGFHSVTWRGRDSRGIQVSTGVYYYRVIAGDFVETRKMLLVH